MSTSDADALLEDFAASVVTGDASLLEDAGAEYAGADGAVEELVLAGAASEEEELLEGAEYAGADALDSTGEASELELELAGAE